MVLRGIRLLIAELPTCSPDLASWLRQSIVDETIRVPMTIRDQMALAVLLFVKRDPVAMASEAAFRKPPTRPQLAILEPPRQDAVKLLTDLHFSALQALCRKGGVHSSRRGAKLDFSVFQRSSADWMACFA